MATTMALAQVDTFQEELEEYQYDDFEDQQFEDELEIEREINQNEQLSQEQQQPQRLIYSDEKYEEEIDYDDSVISKPIDNEVLIIDTSSQPFPNYLSQSNANHNHKRPLDDDGEFSILATSGAESLHGTDVSRHSKRVKNNHNIEKSNQYKRLYIFKVAPLTQDYITVTSPITDQRYFVLLSPELDQSSLISPQNPASLLSMPLDVIRRRIEQRQIESAIERSQRDHDNTMLINPDTELASRDKKSTLWVDKYKPKSFVDLVSPDHLNRDVLSWIKSWDECVFGSRPQQSTSATDKSFAPSALNIHIQQPLSNSKSTVSSKPRSKLPNSNNTSSTPNQNANHSEDTRPEQRVLLLCGPPGLGKTTLAHVLLSHSGYEVLEINASDDRTESVLRDRIRSALENQSMFGNRKPHAIIVDEIDGVAAEGGSDKGAINALIKIISAEKSSSKVRTNTENDKGDESGDGDDIENEQDATNDTSKKEKKGKSSGKSDSNKRENIPYLRRPIICICNDPYVPALRPLRMIARVVYMDKPVKTALVHRLQNICRLEKMQADSRVLQALTECVEMDIRSALNTLQFVHSKNSTLTFQHLMELNVAQKDIQRNHLHVLEGIFSTKLHSRIQKVPSLSSTFSSHTLLISPRNSATHTSNTDKALNGSSLTAIHQPEDSSALQAIFSALDDVDIGTRIIGGLNHNYLSVGYNDSDLAFTSELSEWFSWSDSLHTSRNDEWGSLESLYLPLPAVATHMRLKRSVRPKVDLPNYYLLNQERVRNENILSTFLSNNNELCLGMRSLRNVILDILSPLQEILVPSSLRPIPFYLLNSSERREVEQLVDTMLRLQLTYKQDEQPTPITTFGPVMRLEPPIYHLVIYKPDNNLHPLVGPRHVHRRWQQSSKHTFRTSLLESLNDKLKHMLSKEIDFETMRRADARRLANDNDDSMVITVPQEKISKIAEPKPTPSTTQPPVPQLPAAKPEEESKAPKKLTFLQEHSAKLRARANAKMVARLNPSNNPHNLANNTSCNITSGSGNCPKAVLRNNSSKDPSIHFKFHEGCTIAVRRPVTIGFFLTQ